MCWLTPAFLSPCRLNVGKNDLLTFYDGDDLTANILGQYSGTRSRFKLYTSMADVTIQFQSDPATNIYGYGNGFVVHFFGETLLRYCLVVPAHGFLRNTLMEELLEDKI